MYCALSVESHATPHIQIGPTRGPTELCSMHLPKIWAAYDKVVHLLLTNNYNGAASAASVVQ